MLSERKEDLKDRYPIDIRWNAIASIDILGGSVTHIRNIFMTSSFVELHRLTII